MIRKILTLFLILIIASPMTFARVGQPSFVFAIDENPVAPSSEGEPSSGSNSGGDSGLSGGAITAITLGSIGGAALLGLGGWLYKRKLACNLAAGCIRGSMDPLLPFCIETNPNAEFYARINKNYPYLKKALSLNEIHYCPHSKYLLVYDSQIEKRTFDSVKFILPEGVKSIKITQVSDPFNKGDFSSELFFNKKNTGKNSEPEGDVLKNIKNEINMEGVIMKTVSVDTSKYNSAVYVVTNYSDKKIYAIVFEFIL